MPNCQAFHEGQITGFLHTPERGGGKSLLLTHGAGSNCQAPLLLAVADAFAAAEYYVLRYNLAFRQRRKFGPPHPAQAAADRDGLREAIKALQSVVPGPVCLGGHSYGGRQASMLAAEEPGLIERLLLLSYPLHPPDKPEQLRTAHFANLHTPALFVQGDADPFGSIAEMQAALGAIPGRHSLSVIERAGHDLKRGKFDIAARIVGCFAELKFGAVA